MRRTEHERSSLPRHCACRSARWNRRFRRSVPIRSTAMPGRLVRALLPWTAGIVWELPALRCIGTAFSHRCTTSPDSTFAFHTASRDVQKSCTGRLAAADLRASCSPVQSAPERPPCCGTCAGCSGQNTVSLSLTGEVRSQRCSRACHAMMWDCTPMCWTVTPVQRGF